MNTARRMLLKGAAAGALLTTGIATGLIGIKNAVAAAWPKDAFADHAPIDSVLQALHQQADATTDDRIQIEAPGTAEVGASVPITITANIPDIRSISLFSEKNAVPLVAHYEFFGEDQGYISTRIKMADTGLVTAVVKTGNGLYKAARSVTVPVGGAC